MKINLFLCVITLLALMVESHKHTNELLPPYFPIATNEYQTPVQRYILSLKKIKTINQKREKKKKRGGWWGRKLSKEKQTLYSNNPISS